MAQTTENVEFMMDEILAIHREWISGLYVQERRTEAEITNLLSGQKLIVTLEQVKKCIQEWDLEAQITPLYIPGLKETFPSFYTTRPNQTSYQNNVSSSRSLNPNHPNSTPRTFTAPNRLPTGSVDLNITPINPPDQDRYTTRPLPSIPENPAASLAPQVQACIHGYAPNECLDMQYCLLSLSSGGPSSIAVYTETIHTHEKIAVSLRKGSDQMERRPIPMPMPKPEPEPEHVVEADEVAVASATASRDGSGLDDSGEYGSELLEVKYVRAQDRPRGVVGMPVKQVVIRRINYEREKPERKRKRRENAEGAEERPSR